jgi:hypothetical protein
VISVHRVAPIRGAVDVDLIQLGGIGVVGPGANGYMRALLVELLTREGAPLRVIMSRNELNRLFEGGFDDALTSAFSSRLLVTELLEDAIEHLELALSVSDAEKADRMPADPAATYWIATPGPDDDVVLPLLRGTSLNGVMLGDWLHGPTYVIDTAGMVTNAAGTISETVTMATIDEALANLRA